MNTTNTTNTTNTKIKAYVITCARKLELNETNFLTFKTIRTGFPTAEITVIDNASHPFAIPFLEEAVQSVNVNLIKRGQRRPHWSVIEQIINLNSQDDATPFVILDPDLLFWSDCEKVLLNPHYINFPFVVGRWIPTHFCPYIKGMTMGRLHTSFLFFPNPSNFFSRVAAFYKGLRDVDNIEVNFIKPVVNFIGQEPYFWDTFASLSQKLAGDNQNSYFLSDMLDTYDHIFCGTCMDIVEQLDCENTRKLKETHRIAVTNPDSLKGLWRSQDLYYISTHPEVSEER